MRNDSRDTVLARVRSALGAPACDRSRTPEAGWLAVPRRYAQAPQLAVQDRLALMEERLRDYDAEVTRVTESEIPEAIRALIEVRGGLPTLVAAGFPQEFVPEGAGLVEDTDFTPAQLDGFDGVITESTLAIAETGTLVLQGVPGQGRRATTLVPDFHLCLVRAANVVETVPEAFARLAQTATLPTTFISGPSATADIEMTRIKGVHGPRFLHVLLVLERMAVTNNPVSV